VKLTTPSSLLLAALLLTACPASTRSRPACATTDRRKARGPRRAAALLLRTIAKKPEQACLAGERGDGDQTATGEGLSRALRGQRHRRQIRTRSGSPLGGEHAAVGTIGLPARTAHHVVGLRSQAKRCLPPHGRRVSKWLRQSERFSRSPRSREGCRDILVLPRSSRFRSRSRARDDAVRAVPGPEVRLDSFVRRGQELSAYNPAPSRASWK